MTFPDFSDLSEQERERLLAKARLSTRLNAIQHWERAANTSVVDLANMILVWWKEAQYMDGPVGIAFDETPDFVRVAGDVVAHDFLTHYHGDDAALALRLHLGSLRYDSFEIKHALEQWQHYQDALKESEAISCK